MFARLHLAIVPVLFALVGCTDPAEPQIALGEARNVSDYGLSSLPMTDAARGEFIQLQYKLQSEDTLNACSADEREFLETSLLLYAIAIDEDQTSPWSASQRQRVASLRARWEALGGDPREVSPRCEAVVGNLR